MDLNSIKERIKWLGHDCMRVDYDPVIYFDPYQIETRVKADLILITHEHYDHCSSEDVEKILKPDTVIVTEKDSAKKLEKELGSAVAGKITVVAPGDSVTLKGIRIDAVPSYNLNKKFHPKNKKWLGFVVNVDGVRIYHAGDTDMIPEMSDISCDVAFLPVSGTYVMTAEEAVSAAIAIKPQIAIPMHYGALVGTEEDASIFSTNLEGKIETVVLEKAG